MQFKFDGPGDVLPERYRAVLEGGEGALELWVILQDLPHLRPKNLRAPRNGRDTVLHLLEVSLHHTQLVVSVPCVSLQTGYILFDLVLGSLQLLSLHLQRPTASLKG